MGKDLVLDNVAIILYYADLFTRGENFSFNIRALQFITFTVIYIYHESRVHIFRADIQLARFPLFSFFLYGP